jgi:hypothetical protein
VIGDVEQLEVGEKAARTDAEHKTAAAHVIELRRLGRHHHRIMIGKVDDGGAETDARRLRQERRHEHHGRGDRLAGGGEMLAHPNFVEAEPVGQQRLRAVLGERVGEQALRRMNRHHEQTEPHESSRRSSPSSVGDVPPA